MCSGSECPVLVANLLAQSVWKEFAVKFAFDHKFGCERAPDKQAFLLAVFGDSCPMLFKDVLDMAHSQAKNLVSGQFVQVPPCDILVAGFPCTS
jgi:site-specific DNA-cytosine methylase